IERDPIDGRDHLRLATDQAAQRGGDPRLAFTDDILLVEVKRVDGEVSHGPRDDRRWTVDDRGRKTEDRPFARSPVPGPRSSRRLPSIVRRPRRDRASSL